MNTKTHTTPNHDTATPASTGPHHRDSVLESLGKAIFDPVREAADETDAQTKAARHRAQLHEQQHPDEPTPRH